MQNRLIKILLGLLLCCFVGPGWAIEQDVQVYVDPVDGIRKVRIPLAQAVEGRGITWAISATGRTLAYDSNTSYEVPPESQFKAFRFIQWDTVDREKRVTNPVDPYGFLYQEAITQEGKIGVKRVAFKWGDYQEVQRVSVALMVEMFYGVCEVNFDDDGFPIVTVTIPGTTYVITVTPFMGTMSSLVESGSFPVALSSGTILTCANMTRTGTPKENLPGVVSDTQAIAEWFFFYDQLAMWAEYVESNILEEDISSDSLIGLNPDEIRKALPDFYNDVLDLRDYVAEQEHEENLAFYRRMEKRKEDRERYLEWREEETDQLLEFARAQSRQVAGSEIEVEGQIYLISEEPQLRVPEGRVNIVSESQQITPYDILTPEGDIVRPYRAE